MAGGFLEGVVGGLFQGAEGALKLQNDAIAVRQARRAEEAAAELKTLFAEAAERGGLSKVDDSWFSKAATALAGAGDVKSALSLADAGNLIKANKIKQSAQAAWSLLGAGDYEAALPILNEAFVNMGGRQRFAAVQADGSGAPVVVTDKGQTIPVEKLMTFAERLTMTPEEAIKLALEKAKGEAYVGAQSANALQSLASARRTETLLPHEVASRRAEAANYYASAEASRARAEASRAGAERTAALAPYEVALKQMEVDTARETMPERIAGEKGRNLVDAAKGARAPELVEAELAGKAPNTAAIAKDALSIYNNMVEAFLDNNAVISPEGTMTSVRPEVASEFASPHLQTAMQRRIVDMATAGGLGASEIVSTVVTLAEHAKNVVLAANPELAGDPVLLADVVADMISQPELDVSRDEGGEYIVVVTPQGPMKVYMRRAGSEDQEEAP